MRGFVRFVEGLLGVALVFMVGVSVNLVHVPTLIDVPRGRAWWLVGGVATLFALAFVVEQSLERGRTKAENTVDLGKVADQLAKAVHGHWEREENLRKVNDPAPLPVSWQPAPTHLIDHDADVARSPIGIEAKPLELPGRIEQIAEVYQGVPSRRMAHGHPRKGWRGWRGQDRPGGPPRPGSTGPT